MHCRDALIAITLALAGCHDKGSDVTANAARAEVLPGSVSDAMLNTDQSRTQAPFIEIKPTSSPSPAAKEAPATNDISSAADGTPLGPVSLVPISPTTVSPARVSLVPKSNSGPSDAVQPKSKPAAP